MSPTTTPMSEIISLSNLAWQDRQPEGANADESGPVTTGNMNYRPDGCVHTVMTTNGAPVLAVVWGRTPA